MCQGGRGEVSKVRPKTSWMPCCTGLTRCSLCSMTSRSLSPTTRRSGIFGWRKFSKRLLAPFAVRQESPPFVASAVIFLPCTSRDIPCCLLLLLSFMVNLYRSLGDLSSYLLSSLCVTGPSAQSATGNGLYPESGQRQPAHHARGPLLAGSIDASRPGAY